MVCLLALAFKKKRGKRKSLRRKRRIMQICLVELRQSAEMRRISISRNTFLHYLAEHSFIRVRFWLREKNERFEWCVMNLMITVHSAVALRRLQVSRKFLSFRFAQTEIHSRRVGLMKNIFEKVYYFLRLFLNASNFVRMENFLAQNSSFINSFFLS